MSIDGDMTKVDVVRVHERTGEVYIDAAQLFGALPVEVQEAVAKDAVWHSAWMNSLQDAVEYDYGTVGFNEHILTLRLMLLDHDTIPQVYRHTVEGLLRALKSLYKDLRRERSHAYALAQFIRNEWRRWHPREDDYPRLPEIEQAQDSGYLRFPTQDQVDRIVAILCEGVIFPPDENEVIAAATGDVEGI